jgi:hypothetical protein
MILFVAMRWIQRRNAASFVYTKPGPASTISRSADCTMSDTGSFERNSGPARRRT